MSIKLFEIKSDPGGYFVDKNKSYTCGQSGRFLYLKRTGVTGGSYSCRESFFYHPPKPREMIAYCSGRLSISNLIKWFGQIEKTLKIPVKKRTKIYQTRFDRVAAINPARFWWKNRMRESFLTLFIRTFGSYAKSGGTLKEAIISYDYGYICFPAIEIFLEGHTVPSASLKAGLGSYGGIVSWACSRSKANCKLGMLKEVKKPKVKAT